MKSIRVDLEPMTTSNESMKRTSAPNIWTTYILTCRAVYSYFGGNIWQNQLIRWSPLSNRFAHRTRQNNQERNVASCRVREFRTWLTRTGTVGSPAPTAAVTYPSHSGRLSVYGSRNLPKAHPVPVKRTW